MDCHRIAIVGAGGLLRSGLRALAVEHGDTAVEIGPPREDRLTAWWDAYGLDVAQRAALTGARHGIGLIDSVEDLPVLERIAEVAPELHVVAVVPPGADELSVLAIGRGAAAVVHADCDPIELFASLEATLSGAALVPLTVARALADSSTRTPTDEELSWLRRLALGESVAKVARLAGYAERSFYRRLGVLYQVLGTSNRTEALLEARRQGLL